ncbi:hypothetical protein [Oceanispirochaeta sp. M2]|nr:hypothetical protein [Oceanispirochaeta sp. M2]
MLEMKTVRKPYEGKLHVRFDEGGRGACLYSTIRNDPTIFPPAA